MNNASDFGYSIEGQLPGGGSHLDYARPVRASEYGEGREGWLVESTAYADYPAIPAWEEMGLADLADTFPTEEAAMAAIRSYAA